MSIQFDETMQIFIDESLEHLADIQNDLLAIEAGGADIDENLVNKVYRAAHSIKGGAGFMGLTNIKNLTHEMENILGKIRSREMVPNAEIINILLLASDALVELINNITRSNDIDISNHIESLLSVTNGDPAKKEAAVENETEKFDDSSQPEFISLPDQMNSFAITEDMISDGKKGGKNIYLIRFDLIHDIHSKNKTLSDLITDMTSTGTILDKHVDIDAFGFLQEKELPDQFPFDVLFSTLVGPKDINLIFEINEEQIFELTDDLQVISIAEYSDPDPDVLYSEQQLKDEYGGNELLITTSEIQEEKVVECLNEEEPEKEDLSEIKVEDTKTSMGASDSSLRVNVSLLDTLMNLAGELVLSRNQLLQAISSGDPRSAETSGQRIDLITSELQEAIMLTRMQNIGIVFNKFPRVVRDLAGNLGKNIELSLKGKEVELDKTIIEAIGDPLTHLVRNSVDHGIELPEDRNEAGKNVTGKIILKAYHEAGQVNIEISDDGKGLDGQKLAATATAKGLVTEDQARMMSDKEKVNLIFMPGFSTAEKVTDVSGRGVGMDVVKTNLDRLGGVVDIDSILGEGTTIRIKLPLTLAIIPSQIIVAGGDRYAIPQVNLEELLRIPANQVKDRVEIVGDAEVVRLRGKLLPLIKLADMIGIESTYFNYQDGSSKTDRRLNISDRRSKKSPYFNEDYTDTETSKIKTHKKENLDRIPEEVKRNPKDRRYHASSALNIVVVSTGAMKYGLVVDELNDSEEIVVKPLGRHLKICKEYAGATIMGDGRVALILDVANLANIYGLTSVERSDRATEVAMENDDVDRTRKDRQSILVFRGADEEQFAIPINHVERIEKIKNTDIEEVGGKKVMKYRGGSLALFTIDQVAQVKPMAIKEDLLVIVVNIADREVGIMAVGPVDAREISVEVDDETLKQQGILGSTIIGDHTTLLVDVYGLVHTLNPEWFPDRKTLQNVEGENITILYAEDSNFFRNQVKGFMEEEGYNVIGAEDGIVAWNLLLEHSEEVTLVVTDIEMPNLDGYELSEKIRKDKRFADLPIIALTTMAGEENIAKGEVVGIDDYQIKLDREKLMRSVHNYLHSKHLN
ncbi:MAG: chemotaxis protein CheW [Desulfobacteraceae bacterium]|nr:chemotaxis protein CheW [Desulfobacteraceae bacterium]MDH3572851.1 chemotaxis protein CheW [Desulfobacteraceae bacterium]MDH3722997.1 chemotaxis protein CheW [Desulfobacteraceae bacterium]MDH3836144.1 chemotaxis protein CheW [Desulfobacteraceae bacterium]MDH3873713.1 chemotaxis protein CheW [Desulfobacteraceae bacterium]